MKGTLVIYDSETGGLEARHPTTQVAAIAIRDWQEIDAYEAKIAFDVNAADPGALRVNGYNPETWKREARPERMALMGLFDFFKRHSSLEMISKRTGQPYSIANLVGYNLVSFDVPRLRQMAERNGNLFIPACWWYPLDVYQRALWHFAELGLEAPANYQLTTLAEYFGIEASDAHDALADVRLTAKIAQKLVTWGGTC